MDIEGKYNQGRMLLIIRESSDKPFPGPLIFSFMVIKKWKGHQIG